MVKIYVEKSAKNRDFVVWQYPGKLHMPQECQNWQNRCMFLPTVNCQTQKVWQYIELTQKFCQFETQQHYSQPLLIKPRVDSRAVRIGLTAFPGLAGGRKRHTNSGCRLFC